MSEKHYPYIGGSFDRIIFDGDGSVWVKERTCRNLDIGTCGYFKCSACGVTCAVDWELAERDEPNFCPNCGAKVVEDD